MQDMAALLLALVSGTTITLAFVLYLQPAVGSYSQRALYAMVALAMVVGLGGSSRSLAYLFAERGWEFADILFRLQYILWLVGSGLGPLALWFLDSRRGSGVFVAAIPMFAILLIAFAFTPAFIPFEMRTDPFQVEPFSMTMRWAFPALVGFITLVSLVCTVLFLMRVLAPGHRTIRAHCLFLAVGYGAFTLLVPVTAAMDAGLFALDAGMPLSASVLGAWTLAFLGVIQSNSDDVDRSMRHLRKDLDDQHAHALRDSLTGLYNRGYFYEGLRQAMEQLRRDGEVFAICMLDLDDFKTINDSYGHQTGDQVLLEVARVLLRGCRPYDIAARYGGEEFTIILRNIDRDGALNITERLRRSIGELMFASDKTAIRVTATFGVVPVREPPEDFQELIAKVDKAMYEGKRMGKNQVRVLE